jgi:5-formyltetrahydrofolate cyclo-ligase
MTKQELRKVYLEKRISISDSEYKKLNAKLSENFFSELDLSGIKTLHTFLPIEKTKEPDTWVIIEKIQHSYPNINISIPKINTETALLDNFYFEGENQLKKNTWGIPEPMYGVPTPLEKIEAVLVPLLAFDVNGHRVGYGRGFYDKFLRQCDPKVKKIGLSFFSPVPVITDLHPNDYSLTHAITPERVYIFS